MTRALLYVRVSSHEQAAADRYSLPEQERRLRAYAAERGYDVLAVLSDVESGRRDDRPAYQAMLTRLRAREADVVLVRWLDRFGRRPREILSRIWELQDQGVKVECSDEDVAEELMLLIRAGFAGKESERIAARVRPALAARAAEGKWSGSIPLGYRYSATGKPEPDPSPRCRGVDRAFALYDPAGPDRLSVLGVAERLRAEGCPSPTGIAWRKNTVWTILTNPIYAGDLVAHGVTIRDNHPARVNRELWDRVQARLCDRRHNAVTPAERPDLLGAGLLVCGECGTKMVHTFSRGGTVRQYGVWGCRLRYDRRCQARGISDLALEREFRRALAGLRLPSADEIAASAERLARERSEDSDTTLQVVGLEAEVVRLRAVESRQIEMRENGETTRAQFAERAGATRRQIADAQATLRALKAESAEPDLAGHVAWIRRAAEMLAAGEFDAGALRETVAGLVERVTVGPERRVTISWRPGVETLLGEG